MKKYIRYILSVLYVAVILFGIWQSGKYIGKQQGTVSELQSQQEELQREYTEAEKQYMKYNNTNEGLHEQIMDIVQENQELEERLSRWKKTKTDGSGFFYGHWMIDILYRADDSEEKEYCKDITFQNDYIYLSESYIVNQPVYSVVMRWVQADIWYELEKMGFTVGEVLDVISNEYKPEVIKAVDDGLPTGLFNLEYYVEITLDDIEDWNREIKEEEKDFMQGARYYLLDRDTMVCITQNDGGKVYILMRD